MANSYSVYLKLLLKALIGAFMNHEANHRENHPDFSRKNMIVRCSGSQPSENYFGKVTHKPLRVFSNQRRTSPCASPYVLQVEVTHKPLRFFVVGLAHLATVGMRYLYCAFGCQHITLRAVGRSTPGRCSAPPSTS